MTAHYDAYFGVAPGDEGDDDKSFVIVPTTPEEHATRIASLERELVAAAVEKWYAWRHSCSAVREAKNAKEKYWPLAGQRTARHDLTVAIASLVQFYGDAAHHNLKLTAYQMLKRIVSIVRTVPEPPSGMELCHWRMFFALVAATVGQDRDAAEGIARDLTEWLSQTTPEFWHSRAAAYIVCMKHYEVLERTRV